MEKSRIQFHVLLLVTGFSLSGWKRKSSRTSLCVLGAAGWDVERWNEHTHTHAAADGT